MRTRFPVRLHQRPFLLRTAEPRGFDVTVVGRQEDREPSAEEEVEKLREGPSLSPILDLASHSAAARAPFRA